MWATTPERAALRRRAAAQSLALTVDSVVSQFACGYEVTAYDEQDKTVHALARALIGAGVSGAAWRHACEARVADCQPRPTGAALAMIDEAIAALAPFADIAAANDRAAVGVFRSVPTSLGAWPVSGGLVAATSVVFDALYAQLRYSSSMSDRFDVIDVTDEVARVCGDNAVLELASRLASDTHGGVLINPRNALNAAIALQTIA